MWSKILCKFFGLHQYEVFKEKPLVDIRNIQIGVTYVLRCKNCGRLKNHTVYTEKHIL